jgi:hypothetical protein
LVGSWLFCLQNFPCLVSFWCMHGGSVEVWTKNSLYRLMKGQTHFGMPRGAKINDKFPHWHHRRWAHSPPTLAGVGHQRTISIIIGCIQRLSQAKPSLKVALVGRNYSFLTRTSMCGWAINFNKHSDPMNLLHMASKSTLSSSNVTTGSILGYMLYGFCNGWRHV